MNPIKAQPDWPPVVVAGAYQTGVVLMRDLNRRGLRVYGVECKPTMQGFHTVYGKVSLCPNPDDRPDDWIAFMIALADSIGQSCGLKEGVKPVLISAADQFVTAIAAHADALDTRFTFCRSSAALQALLATKECQYEMAEKHGLSVPKSRFVRSAKELQAFASESRLPILLKPVHFREWERLTPDNPLCCQKVGVARTAEELETLYALASAASPELVAQEIIAGPDTNKLVYMSCYARDGRRLATCMVKQIRTDPIYFGSSSLVEPVSDPEADAACDGFLKGIGYWGICEIELKRDSRDGVVRMIEANPRYSVTADSSVFSGVEIGWIHYLDLIGQPVTPVHPSGKMYRHIVLMRDFACVPSYFKEGLLTWRGLLQSYKPPVAFFDFDLKDWRVTGRTVVHLTKLAAKPVVRHFFPKKRKAN